MKRCLALALCLMLMLPLFTCAQAEGAPYYIDVDIANQIVTVYESGRRRGTDNIVRQMICSTGVGDSTPTGMFYMPEKKYDSERTQWYYFYEYEVWAQYASRIYKGILFHSVLFKSRSNAYATWGSNHALGSKASHGCIRLRTYDAEWIAKNCPVGTCVHIFDGAERDEPLRELLKLNTFDRDLMSYDEFLEGKQALRRGMKGDEVRAIQQKLRDLGYDINYVDGIFGADTERLVRVWQHSRGLYQSGLLTPEQQEMLMAQAKALPTPTPSPMPTPSPTPSPTPDISSMEGTIALVTVDPESYLILREKPDVESARLAILHSGTPVQVLREGLVWSLVSWEDQTGYVGSKYIEIVRRSDELEESKT